MQTNSYFNRFLSAATLLLTALATAPHSGAAQSRQKRYVANPVALNYRFQPDGESRREAADPTCVLFQGDYYLFASKSGGYWHSADLVDWTYVKTSTISSIEQYAPVTFVYGDALYLLTGGGQPRLWRNATPKHDTWQEQELKFRQTLDDPSVLVDDDGRVYFYSGCHDVAPIRGIEVDPRDGFSAKGEFVDLILHRSSDYGWEAAGANNELNKDGWNEGSAILKLQGKYYLQYGAPGTQWRSYADGCYVSDRPLGPYRYCADSPFSIKQGGFIGGAGHGDTFHDKYGNLWHVATMIVGQRHWFERRVGLFPVSFSPGQGLRAHTAFTDYPFEVPQQKVDFDRLMAQPPFALISKDCPATASTVLDGHEPRLATDERVETWWSAATGNKGEWLQVDLGRNCRVSAVQVNFADEGAQIWAPHDPVVYQYVVETSTDGRRWKRVADLTDNRQDQVHRLLMLPRTVKARYVRLTCAADVVSGQFSVYDLRIFGPSTKHFFTPVEGVSVVRDAADARHFTLTWKARRNATGYVVSWGTAPDRLIHQTVVYSPEWDAHCFNRQSDYHFRVEAF